MEALMWILVYLDKDYGKTIIIDPMIPKVDASTEIQTNWLNTIYGKDKQEEIPDNTPKPVGKLMSVNVFVGASRVGENMNDLSHTGILVYVNITPIDWLYKRQNTVETSPFGAELIAAWIYTEKVKALHTKLQWLGIPINRQTCIFFDNESVVKSTSRPESTLSNKQKLIYWQSVKAAISAGQMRVLKDPGETNLADIFTK